MIPPVAKRKDFYTEHHKDKVLDPYFWLREKENPEVIEHLKKENAYFNKMIRPFSGLTNDIFKELKARLPQSDEGVPVVKGGHEFFYRYVVGKQYIEYCKKAGKKVIVLVDFNKLVKKGGYLSTHHMEVSPDGKYFAYSIDTKGDEICDIIVIETSTRKILTKLTGTGGYFAWSNVDMLYYSTPDGHIRNDKIWRHILGQDQKSDNCIFHEADQRYFSSFGASSSRKYLIIHFGETLTSYAAYSELDDKKSVAQVFCPKKEGILYKIDHGTQRIYIRTNEKAINIKILHCKENQIAKKNWRELITHSDDVHILDFELKEKFLCIHERSKGLPKARIINIKTDKTYYIKFPEAAYNMSFNAKAFSFDDNKIRVRYSSPITPPTILDYDLITKKNKTRKVEKVNKFKSSKYQVEYVMVTGHDKVKIPLCLVFKKGLKKNSKAPTVLYGYGSYGATIGYNFSSSLVSLLDRGVVYATAGIRGGADLGRKWYEDGKFLKKKNTFLDFISCSEYLIKNKYTSAEHLAARGGSAGGLLVGAVANMRPDLYKVICAHVPFVDVINTMFDDSLPLTQGEYNEWGNPHDKMFYNYMKSYSPYDNVTELAYPNMYITGGLNDQRVTYWEPTKWAQKLRDFNSSDNDVLLKINMGEGHFGKSGRFDSLKEVAQEYSYLIKKLSTKTK
ncbi:MAG: S9 family peptidase [Bdellovibrionales bacterium]|nr:S9 family peptidase [Bdellovibrionales bacterium]